MAKIMAKINERGLPLNFTAKHLFPEEWPKIDRAGQHRTPPQHSLQWRAIVDFRESESWKEGDLKRLADYFGVSKSTLSEKIKKTLIDRNTESSRKVLGKIPERHKRNKPSSLKDAPEVQALPLAGEPPNIVQQGVLRLPGAQRRGTRPRALRSVTPRAGAPEAGSRYASALYAPAESDGALSDDGGGFNHLAASERWPTCLSTYL